MATKLRELRIQARKLKIPNARELDLDELKAAVAEAEGNKNGKGSKSKAVKAVKKATGTKRGPGRPRKVVEDDDDDEDEAPKKRGRPKGSTNKKATAKKATGAKRGRPRKSEPEEAPKRRGRPPKAESKRSAPERKQARKTAGNKLGRPVGSGTGTRVKVPEQINWDKDFDFREGTIADVILEELRSQASKKRNKDTGDIREATIEALTDDLGSDPFVFKHRDGSKYSKTEARNMLRYRVNRTIFDYVKETGQHGKDGSAKKRGRPAKVEAEAAPKRRGRPPGSGKAAKQAKAEKGTGKRRGRPPGSGKKVAATASTGKKRGRPKGSKNKR